MKKYLLSILSLSLPILSLSGGLWSEAQAGEWVCKTSAPLGEAEPDEYIVKCRDLCPDDDEAEEITPDDKKLRKMVWKLPDGEEEEFCNLLKESGQFEYFYPNYRLRTEVRPNDPEFPQQWGLEKIGMESAWDIPTGGTQVVVAVIDSGIDYNHPDLAANMWKNPGEVPGNGIDDDGNRYIDDVYGFDFANGEGDPMDDYFHGTHCAGIVAAVGNNSIGIAGVNWSAKLMAVKFSGNFGMGTEEKAIAAIDYATRMGAKIISASWGGGGAGPALEEAIQRAKDKGVLFVASAGNKSEDTDGPNGSPHYPSNYTLENIISVASIDQNEEMAKTSNYGAISIDLGAPGVNILSTMPGGEYKLKSGTSMATPHVTGVAALILAAYPHLTFPEVKDRILASVDPVSSLAGKTVTGGRLNAYKALTYTSSGVPVASCRTSATGMTATFDGTGSLDTDEGGSSITDYSWTISPPVDLSTKQGEKQFSLDFSQAGTYVATLTVTDNEGVTDDVQCQVTVPWPQQGTSCPLGSPPLTADFDAETEDNCIGRAKGSDVELNPESCETASDQTGYEVSSENTSGGTCESGISKCTWTVCKQTAAGCNSVGPVKDGCKFSEVFNSEGTYRITPMLACNDGKLITKTVKEVKVLPSLGGGFAGGISVNKGSYKTIVTQKLCHTVEVIGEIKPANPTHVNQTVDIVVYADYPTPEGTLSFMLDSNGWPLLWDKNPANLVAFKPKVTLTSPHLVPMYTGQFVLPGHLLVYVGYRLPEGTLVNSSSPIDIMINP